MAVFGDIGNKLKEKKDLQRVHRPALNLQFYGFNCEHPLLKNPELRLALSQAIDHEKLVSEAYSGQEEVARGLLPPGLPGYHPHDLGANGDLKEAIERAKRALGNTPLPVSIEIVSNSQSPQARAELEFVSKSWAPLGIDVQKKFIPDWSQFEKYLKSDAMQIYRYVWFADIPDADDILRPLFSSHSQFNFTRYQNSEVDEMLQKALGIVDPVERARLYQQIEEKILKSSPVIPLAHLSIDYVYQPNVQGIEVSSLGAQTMSFNRVWLKAPSR
jgi:ABC-type oligopeptide transport system substrate-binding subunit